MRLSALSVEASERTLPLLDVQAFQHPTYLMMEADAVKLLWQITFHFFCPLTT